MASQIVVIANLIFLSFCIYVDADTPANCTYEEISGSWLFSIGEGGHDNTIDCSSFKPVSELHVTLLFPDVAVDSDGNVGFWTLIYNQGFEVNINGVVYFAFSSYEKSGEKVISFCDKTLNGWMPQRVIMLEIGLVTAVRFYKFEDFLKIYEKRSGFLNI